MAIKYRVKCPRCGEVMNLYADGRCEKCGTPVTTQFPAMLQLYRMGNYVGVATGFGLYINNVPYGYIGNKESLRIPLPYGTYTLHVAMGMSRKCKDLTFTLTPQAPVMYAKTRITLGVWSNTFIIEPARPEEMPND